MTRSPNKAADWKKLTKRALLYAFGPAFVASACWDAGVFVMAAVFVVLLPLEVMFVESAFLLARRKK